MLDRTRLPERIEDGSLLLRRWTVADVDLLADAVERNLDHLRPRMAWAMQEPISINERRTRLEQWEREWSEGGDCAMAIVKDGGIAGSCGLHRRRGPHGLEIGYWVDKDHLGRGIGTRVASLLTTAAFSVPGIAFVEIHHDHANIRSRQIPQRLGYTFLGESPDSAEASWESGVDCTWQMTKAVWSQSRHRFA